MPFQEYLTAYFDALRELFSEVWIFFLIGLLIAALIQEFVSTKRLLKYFGGNDFASLTRATAAGLFVSVCSCGAIPIAATLRERGASTASALTFLIAGPWGGLFHFILISRFVGISNAFILLIFTLALALIVGTILAKLENQKLIESAIPRKHKKGETRMCIKCMEVEHLMLKHEDEKLSKRLLDCTTKNVWHIFKDIGKYIIIGLLIAAAIKAFVPSGFISNYLGNEGRFLPVLIAVPASMIMELASEGLAVVAGQLYLLGASLGVVFVVLMVGVASDITELSMIWGRFGKRTAFAYFVISTTTVILFAWMINLIV